MVIETSDVRSSANEHIAHAAKVIGRSHVRREVFKEIHRGKKRIKTIDEIEEKIKLKRIRILQEANYLYNQRIIKKISINGKLAYERDDFYFQNKRKILKLAENKDALEKFPTKRNLQLPKITIKLPVVQKLINIQKITIDDIDSFKKVKEIELAPKIKYKQIKEKYFKIGLQKIIGEEGIFNDWGGENDDLYSTRLIINRKRLDVSFGLKGRGTKGKLTPKKMGTQGDQVQRLFRTTADVFIVQYWYQIGENILEQLEKFAIAKSVLNNKKIYYGVIDGQDTIRLLLAYPECFQNFI